MKKILATVLALAMIACMSIPAFATSATLDALNEAQTIDIGANYVKTDATTDTTPVYSVNIVWDAISFTFTEAADVKTWNPENLQYEVSTNNTNGVWSGNDATIEITNKSNAGVVVTPSWEKATGGADVVISGAVTLGTAVGAGAEGANAATEGTITVSKPISGTIAQGITKLGTLTLTLTAAPAN